jgi:uncharacterized protein (TIGR03000 family)
MRALFWTFLMGSAALIVTLTAAPQAEARWGRFGWGWHGGYGFKYPRWGGYYPGGAYADPPYYAGLYGYPYYGYPPFGYYAPGNYASMSTVPSLTSGGRYNSAQAQLPQPAGDVSVAPANAGVIRVLVPDEFADVTFDGYNVSSIGTRRTYVTPNLEPGKSFRYEIKASWLRGNQRTSRQAVVAARDGQISTIDFRREVAKRSDEVR